MAAFPSKSPAGPLQVLRLRATFPAPGALARNWD
jgi:hypothetical protein